MPAKLPAHYPTTRRNSGFTLVELMISIAIGLVLMLGLTTLLVNSSATRTELEKSSRQIENGRYAMQIMSDDIRLAGYYGEYFFPSSATSTTPDPCATAVASLGWNSTTPTIPTPIYGYTGSESDPSCVTNRKSGTGILVIRRVQTVSTTTAASGTPYLQVSLCDTESTPFVLDTTGLTLKQKDCSTTAVLRKYVVHIYYISSCNVCSPSSDGIPTLKRVEIEGGAISVVPLTEGIDSMQFDYGIDYLPAAPSQDGSPDCYITNPSATDSTVAPLSTEIASCPAGTWNDATKNWANVTTVRLNVLARNTETTVGYSDSKSYNLGLAGTAGPFDDAYKRHVYTGLVRVVNTSGRREKP